MSREVKMIIRTTVLTRMTVYETCTVSRRGTSSTVDCGSPEVVDQSSSAPRRVQHRQQTTTAAHLHVTYKYKTMTHSALRVHTGIIHNTHHILTTSELVPGKLEPTRGTVMSLCTMAIRLVVLEVRCCGLNVYLASSDLSPE